MAIFYTVNPIGFYNEDFGAVPEGAKPISEQERNALLFGQSEGRAILADGTGKLYLGEKYNPPPVIEND